MISDACPTCGDLCGMREFTRPYEERDDWLDEKVVVERPASNSREHAWARFVQLGGTSREAFNTALDTYTAHTEGDDA